MTRSVLCQPLAVADYAPYGGVISTDVVTDRTVVVNNGTARRTPEVVPTINKYSEAPSQTPARTVLNVSLASPREVQPWTGGEKGNLKRVMKIKMLERHRFSTQSFVPMGADIQYLVVVTQNKSESDDSPDLDKLRGFIARDKQGVCYAPGVWHAPMAVIDNVSACDSRSFFFFGLLSVSLLTVQSVSFAIVQHVNGVADEDCQFYHLDEEIEIVF